MFTHLHVASGYSMQFGASSPDALVERAAELGLSSLALTDRDGLYGAVKFVSACSRASITPLLGVDVAVAASGLLAGIPAWADPAAVAARSRDRGTPVRGGGVVEGRDIGTVVFPDAEVKFYMTARPDIRAMRRYNELKGRGVVVDYASVLENIERRDDDDLKRAADPLLKAPDAFEIDNSDLTSSEQFDIALGHVVKAIGVA